MNYLIRFDCDNNTFQRLLSTEYDIITNGESSRIRPIVYDMIKKELALLGLEDKIDKTTDISVYKSADKTDIQHFRFSDLIVHFDTL